ncbi:MAG: hypothetical protein M3332_14535 [Actinomycetota bacterium]|nr:hypothetical protein [Actinomycetota bacterium]
MKRPLADRLPAHLAQIAALLIPPRRKRTCPRAIKRARHNSYRIKKPGEPASTRHPRPPTINIRGLPTPNSNMIYLSYVALPVDRAPDPAPHRHREIVQRLLRGVCEICKQDTDIEVHQIRKLADLTEAGKATRPEWVKIMTSKRRKTLMVCQPCHHTIHTDQPATPITK